MLSIFISCSNDPSDDLNEAGPLDEAVFKQNNGSFGKVMQGNDGTYNYKAFGNFKNSGTAGLFIPQDISFIEQTLIDTDERTIIKVDQNFLPISISNVSAGIKDSLEYHVFYTEEEILIFFDEENEDGTYTTLSKITLPTGLPTSGRTSIKVSSKIQEDSGCDIFSEDSDINPCSDNNIYEDVAQDWEDYTEGTPIQGVGKAVSWILQISLAKICSNSNKNMSSQASGFSCEDLKENKSKENLCGILISCETDCAGEVYGAAYNTPCHTCVGGKTKEIPLKVSWTYKDLSEGCWTMYAHISGGQPPYSISWGESSTVFCGELGAKGGVTVTDSSGCTASSTWIISTSEEASAKNSESFLTPVLL